MLIYPDANVLIALASGLSTAPFVFSKLFKSGAVFVTSNLLELETVPATVYVGDANATEVLRRFFHRWKPRAASGRTVALAAEECERLPLGSMDALHLAAAHLANADVFLTLEKVTKPMHRSTLVKVVHLDNVVRHLDL